MQNWIVRSNCRITWNGSEFVKKLKVLTVLLTVLVVALNGIVVLSTGKLDSKAPEIVVPDGVLELRVDASEEEYLKDVTAWDNRDGDVTDRVMVEHISQFTGDETVKVTYGVFDQAGNGATATRTVRFTDYTGPKFQLTKPLSYGLGRTVTLMDRLTAWDDVDGEITNKIRVISPNLSNDVVGIYRIRVQVTNSLGDTQVLELPVLIEEVNGNTPEITLTDYIVYLEKGTEFDLQDYLDSVTDPASEEKNNLSRVEIQSGVDLKQPGTYDVVYSYEGEKEDTRVILTVVVMA